MVGRENIDRLRIYSEGNQSKKGWWMNFGGLIIYCQTCQVFTVKVFTLCSVLEVIQGTFASFFPAKFLAMYVYYFWNSVVTYVVEVIKNRYESFHDISISFI